MRYIFMISCLILSGCVTSEPEPRATIAQPAMAATGQFDGMFGLFRAQNGLDPVRANAQLTAIAQAHAQDMAASGAFSHTGSDGSALRDRLRRGGYKACLGAENIGNGYPDEQTVFQGWQGSDGHRRNMMLAEVEDYGLARAGPYWVLVLADPC